MVLFAVLAIVLIAVSGSVVDFTYTQTARTRGQTALDSAALALQTRILIDNNATLKSKAQAILTERLGDAAITATVDTVTVDTTEGKINLQGSLTVPTSFVQLVGIKTITSHLTSEVTQGSKDIEVAVALDTTGSMAGQKLADLKTAMNGTASVKGLIDAVEKDHFACPNLDILEMKRQIWMHAFSAREIFAGPARSPGDGIGRHATLRCLLTRRVAENARRSRSSRRLRIKRPR